MFFGKKAASEMRQFFLFLTPTPLQGRGAGTQYVKDAAIRLSLPSPLESPDSYREGVRLE